MPKSCSTIVVLLAMMASLSACASPQSSTQPPGISVQPSTENTPETVTSLPPTATTMPTLEPQPIPTLDISIHDLAGARQLFDYEPSKPLPFTEVGRTEDDGIIIRDLKLASPFGGAFNAFLVSPNTEDPKPGILWVHWYETGAPDANRKEFLEDAKTMAKSGAVSLLVDDVFSLPGARKKWGGADPQKDAAIIIQQVVELRYATDFLITEGDADPARLAFVGHDFGAMFGTVLGAADPRFKTYILMALTGDFADWFRFGSPLKGTQWQDYAKSIAVLAPEQALPLIDNATFFFQFADKDNFVSASTAKELSEAVQGESNQTKTYSSDHALQHNNTATNDRIKWLIQELGLSQ